MKEKKCVYCGRNVLKVHDFTECIHCFLLKKIIKKLGAYVTVTIIKDIISEEIDSFEKEN